MNTWGERFKVSIFGESHGKAIGAVLDGVPSGTELDEEYIKMRMDRRKPGKNLMSTTRVEGDRVKIVSGFVNGKTTGTPMCGIIENRDMRSKDYQGELMRPGHADYTAYVKYGESRDFRGGGHFSGRITAPLVFAGAVAEQVLKKYSVTIGTHIYRVGDVYDTPFDPVSTDINALNDLEKMDFPVLNSEAGEKMREEIDRSRLSADSVGGILECAICGMPAGVGSPFFGSVESRLSSMMFSVPAVKGIEFGKGFGFAGMHGSEANDEFYIENGQIKTRTNNNAGINGGITNGMPIIFRLAIKPTASIGQTQNSIDIEKMENTEIKIHGRHDPCIVHRAASVVSAAAAITILDMILGEA